MVSFRALQLGSGSGPERRDWGEGLLVGDDGCGGGYQRGPASKVIFMSAWVPAYAGTTVEGGMGVLVGLWWGMTVWG